MAFPFLFLFILFLFEFSSSFFLLEKFPSVSIQQVEISEQKGVGKTNERCKEGKRRGEERGGDGLKPEEGTREGGKPGGSGLAPAENHSRQKVPPSSPDWAGHRAANTPPDGPPIHTRQTYTSLQSSFQSRGLVSSYHPHVSCISLKPFV